MVKSALPVITRARDQLYMYSLRIYLPNTTAFTRVRDARVYRLELHVHVLCCFALFVCLTLLASFFLPSHLSFKNMYCIY